MYFLICNPALYRRLQQELDKTLLENGGDATHKMLASIPLLDAVIHEALRFGSPYYLPRIVPEGGALIAGQLIPAGTIIAGASHAQQMSEENFYPHPRVSLESSLACCAITYQVSVIHARSLASGRPWA